MKHCLPILTTLLFAVPLARAQSTGPSVLNATGNSQTIAGNTYEYAIGDVISGNSFESPTLVVTPGVLQPAGEDPNSIPAPGISAGLLQVYPNPASRTLFLQPHFDKEGDLQYVLYDGLGRVVQQRTVRLATGNERQEVPMSAFAAGQYMLQVQWSRNGHARQAAYKIQKIK